MNLPERFTETLNNYSRHGWQLRRVLLRPESRAEMAEASASVFGNAPIEESTVDALWFSRASHAGREAWELRLVAETPYALFETFEADEAEEDREEVRLEMQARLRDYAARS
ncbi:MAG TPA: hypothetical protein VEQ40_02155 [Pyrinomonadaceae bacterium]|nr:hypothetical protein [Pyrinomonadaceae bacterium]